jgi:hypothetical protein
MNDGGGRPTYLVSVVRVAQVAVLSAYGWSLLIGETHLM